MKKIYLGAYSGGKRVVTKKYALVDDEDFDELSGFKWHLSHRYARKGNKKYKTQITMHHYLMGMPQIGHEVDHINGNPLDNRRGNLRVCSSDQNKINRLPNKNKKLPKGVTKVCAGYKGIKRYRARIRVSTKEICIGYFQTPDEAAYVYDQFSIQLFGAFAKTNYQYV